jgi:hypothetical protein
MRRWNEMDEMAMGLEQETEQELESSYEAMIWRINEAGYRERSLQEIDKEVAGDLFRDLTWQERAPLKERLGNVRGMMKYLRSRPSRFHKAELELLKTLRTLEVMGEALGLYDPNDADAVEGHENAEDRCLFEAGLFAATQEFFDLVERLDEPWCV